jgi:hypothetical protein
MGCRLVLCAKKMHFVLRWKAAGRGWKTKNVWGGQSGADISERDWVPLHVCVNVALIEEGTLRVGAVSVLMVSVLLSIPF